MCMGKEGLRDAIENHWHWLETEGKEGARANLRNADLLWADLREARLCQADLCGADLLGVDLCGADLREADLQGTNLQEANLAGADLQGAKLDWANLAGANLEGVRGLSIARISQVQTAFGARLDRELKEQIEASCPHLLDGPEGVDSGTDDGGISEEEPATEICEDPDDNQDAPSGDDAPECKAERSASTQDESEKETDLEEEMLRAMMEEETGADRTKTRTEGDVSEKPTPDGKDGSAGKKKPKILTQDEIDDLLGGPEPNPDEEGRPSDDGQDVHIKDDGQKGEGCASAQDESQKQAEVEEKMLRMMQEELEANEADDVAAEAASKGKDGSAEKKTVDILSQEEIDNLLRATGADPAGEESRSDGDEAPAAEGQPLGQASPDDTATGHLDPARAAHLAAVLLTDLLRNPRATEVRISIQERDRRDRLTGLCMFGLAGLVLTVLALNILVLALLFAT